MKKKRIELYHLTSFERTKLQYVEEIIADGLNPFHVSIDTVGGEIRFGIRDIRHWQMKHKPNFIATLGMKYTS